MCCLIFSRRGLAYFGVFVQLLVALMIIPVITLLVAYTAGTSRDGSGRHLSSPEMAFVVIYCLGLCLLAGIIFAGIRTDSLQSLYISIASLMILQLFAGVITILSWKPDTFFTDEKEVLIRVTCLTLNIISTITYLCILICYTSHLKNKLRAEYEAEEEDFYYHQSQQ
ncbi:hypothetical protein Fcan01_09230 [Folsomia candida]|uniref:Uncharacterized protein n=1 Tax=Folsomia candida TaxID=158441 RepID=A0A226EG09_FOLCA|nr:hypothetical protein Fcan01_09230 [Folsomia candida]